jgi:hypothetical protein
MAGKNETKSLPEFMGFKSNLPRKIVYYGN